MRILGLEITRAVRPATAALASSPASPPGYGRGGGGWFPIVRDWYPGAWQNNDEISVDSVLAYSAVFACITLIASDIGKLRLRLVGQDADGIWSEVDSPAFSPVLRKPNHYQTRVKFIEQWVISKLTFGNTYVLKERDQRGVVIGLYVLNPCRVQPLIAPNGDVYYQLQYDDGLSGVPQDGIVAPQSEIIHDIMYPLYHPLVGVSPIYACGLAALQGLRIQQNSAAFFGNGSQPGGVLTAPGAIADDTATRLKEHWDSSYSGTNAGKVAVLGDGLHYEPMAINAVDSQLIEQLKWSAETVCSCFHVPPYMIGAQSPPAYNNIEALSQAYYSQCLQALLENAESCLDEGLGLNEKKDGVRLGTEFDLQDLLRMDTPAKVKAAADAIGAGFLKPNEARAQFDLKPVKGGDTPYLQQQNFSLAALEKRDRDDPFAKPKPAPTPDPAAAPPGKPSPGLPSDDTAAAAAAAKAMLQELRKGLAHV